MFTGIIKKTAEIESLVLANEAGCLCVRAGDWDPGLELGESIAVQGICLSLAAREGEALYFDVLKETLDRTNLGHKQPGQHVNLERALRLGDPLGGHLVSGHIDGTGTVRAITPVGRDFKLEIACGTELLADMIYKGSIGLDGISLTLAELGDDFFTVHIIPHTWAFTTLHELNVGDLVNVEVDIYGKYLRRFLQQGKVPATLTWEQIQQEGLLEE